MHIVVFIVEGNHLDKSSLFFFFFPCHLNDVCTKGNAETKSSSAVEVIGEGFITAFEAQDCLSCSLMLRSVLCHIHKTLLLPSSYAYNFQEHPPLADVPNTAM